MLKIYVYMSYTSNLIITFERKIMQCLSAGSNGKFSASEARKQVMEQIVFNSCLRLDYKSRYSAVLEHGVVEIIAMLTQRALSMQDPFISLMSRYLVYSKQIGEVSVKLYFREKMFVTKQLLVVKKSFKILQTCVLETKYSLTCLHTFLCTGTFKIRDLYVLLEDETRTREGMSRNYMDYIQSNVHVNFGGMGSTASVKKVPSANFKMRDKLTQSPLAPTMETFLP